jgi:hypothetical protein
VPPPGSFPGLDLDFADGSPQAEAAPAAAPATPPARESSVRVVPADTKKTPSPAAKAPAKKAAKRVAPTRAASEPVVPDDKPAAKKVTANRRGST